LITNAKAVAERMNEFAIPFGQRRLAEMGERESGAYNFYKVRLDRSQLFADYELALADALAETLGDKRLIHEIGSGYGTFSWLMAGLGFHTVCLELDRLRYNGGIALWGAILAGWKDIPGSVRFVNDRFPSASLESDGACAVITNLVATTTEVQRSAMLAALTGYHLTIVDIDRFLVHATTPEQRIEVIDRFAAAGFNTREYLDLGKSGNYYTLSI
jgi:hypothetical protein